VIVVADTSVLLNLAFLGQESLLSSLFGAVHVPAMVAQEFSRMAASSGRFAGLSLPAFCRITAIKDIPAAIASDPRLDSGESEALALALSIKADAVLLDEAAGRECAASLGMVAIGTLGLLVRAKNDGHLPLVAPLLRSLLVEGRFRVSPALVRATLQRAGELP
jgi:predicted nucleic acid-binding protein